MDSATQDLYQTRLNELIYDEEKIVTCLSVASDLKISLTEVQCLIEIFVKDRQNLKSGDLHVTYLLSGTLKDGKGAAVCLVKQEDLSNKKGSFEKISTEQVYSIQRSKQIDFNLIASVDAPCVTLTGLIVGKNCVKRILKNKKLYTPQAEPSDNKDNITFPKKLGVTKLKSEIQENGDQPQQSSKSSKAKQNGGIANFFAKAPVKTANSNKIEADKIKTEKPNDKKVAAKDGGITSFFSKAPVKTTNNVKVEADEIKTEEVTAESKNDKTEPKYGIVVVETSDDECPIKEISNTNLNVDDKSRKESVEKKPKGHNNKKRKRESKSSNPNKKRKRIQEVCDSDSSDIFDGDDDDENQDIIEKSDEEPFPVAIACTPTIVPKNKKRKAVDKTYTDDEGFLVTTTEYIYESASDEEKQISAKPEIAKTQAKKHSTTNTDASHKQTKKKQISGKQPTLMSFFKKN